MRGREKVAGEVDVALDVNWFNPSVMLNQEIDDAIRDR